ncbi:hypothetical protein [Legionella feeleii]|uniref:Transmembrane protein n=1 Tax=Legionella feeleii TaxID=453 RepID=A0A378IVU0_9GAMM|nr:hypothetical protein [Legionella feeleii]STX39279.1 Uncharacterised protein [Legionella feeleii]
MSKINKSLAAIILLIVTFMILILSISKIISIANKNTNDVLFVKTKEAQVVNSLLKSSQSINYETLSNKLSFTAPSYVSTISMQKEFKVPFEIKKYPQNEQNYLIRIKLLEWKIDQLETNFYNTLANSQPSVISNIWTWFWSAIGLICATVLAQVTTYLTQRYIIQKLPS